ncbi:ornithine cyclodeaminase family protein [Streptosporangiaceae bacterium NEAU-GS5]|nr:ornithine cyclodeaminase family protein [Streptosporangiaceae bacterium NEAU-GS5]
MTDRIPLIDSDQIRRLLSPREAVQAIVDALQEGLDPAADPARTAVSTAHGQLLLMPAEGRDHAGVKVVTVAPDNPARGQPRIQGLYLLFDAATLRPIALLDGMALTTLRTPAVSVAATLPFLLRSHDPLRIAVFGMGPQGRAHVDTVTNALAGHRGIAHVTYLARRPLRPDDPLNDIDQGQGDTPPVALATSGSVEAARAVAQADLIVCATTAREPLFDSATIQNHAVVIAVGSHEPDAREVDGALTTRAYVIVEDVATAMREAGDVIQALDEGHLNAADLIPMRQIVADSAVSLAAGRPVLFKSTGMSWEDLVVATAVYQRFNG